MRHYKQITSEQRYQISGLLKAGSGEVLGYRTPFEVFFGKTVHDTKPPLGVDARAGSQRPFIFIRPNQKALMKTPKRIEALVQDGLVDEVIRQLMSGKEATVYVVRCGEEIRCAKVYKEASKRSFRQSVDYTEGRKVKNSRRARAMEKGTSYGRKAQEEVWQNAEVDALYRLAAVGVRVPKPYNFHEGVLLMELMTDSEGNVAPRLHDMTFTAELSREYHRILIAQVVRMLCAGVVHGDLSEYNVLVDRTGPVIIDLPQAIDAAANNQACQMLLRDVENLATYFGQFAPELLTTDYGNEIWSLYQNSQLQPDSLLTGRFERIEKPIDLNSVMREINDTLKEEDARQMARAIRASQGFVA